MFRAWGATGSPIFAEIEGGRGQNGTFLGDFTWNDPYDSLHVLDLFFPYELSILKLTFFMKHPVGAYLVMSIGNQECGIPRKYLYQIGVWYI